MDTSTFGPLFALQDRQEAADQEAAGWRPLRDLYDGHVLDECVGDVSHYLQRMSGAAIETRVAASTWSMAVFPRLVAPALGASVLGTRLPRVDLDSMSWIRTLRGPWPMSVSGPGLPPDPAAVVEKVVLPLAEVIAGRFSLSMLVLRGNAASGVFGAIRLIAATRPDLAGRALDLGRRLLGGVLSGTGSVVQRVTGPGFIRSSCCLYYRVPGAPYCGDCILARDRP